MLASCENAPSILRCGGNSRYPHPGPLPQGRGELCIPSPPKGERVRVRGLRFPWRARSVIAGIEEVAQAVARQVEREREREDREARPPRHPRRRIEELLS